MSKEWVPGLEGIVAAESDISYIDGQEGVLEYRGFNIKTLAENCTFEEAAYLLLEGHLPKSGELEAFSKELVANRELSSATLGLLKALPAEGHPMKAIQAGCAVLGAEHPMSNLHDADDANRAIARLIAQMPTMIAAFFRLRNGQEPVAPRSDLSHAANFLYMLEGAEPHPVIAKTMDVALIIHMEHTMNASTFTGRVVASTMADPYAVVSSAIGSLTGPLHGGANERALANLRTIPSVEEVDELIGGKIERKEKIMGLGHRVYKTKDPRATILQGLVEAVFEVKGSTPIYEIARRVESIATEKLGHKGIYPNVDFYSGIVYDRMGIPADLFTPIFAVARVVGWLAHWKAQIIGNRIFRPTQIYKGGHDQPYVAESDR